jgi:hypothetical protein
MSESTKDQSILEFEVDGDSGTLSVANFAQLTTRSEFYEDIADSWDDSPQELFDAMSECQPLAWEVESIYSEVRDEIESALDDAQSNASANQPRITALKKRLANLPEEPEEGAADWLLSLTTDEFESRVTSTIERWFDDEPNWGFEEDYLPSGWSAQGVALNYFRNMDEKLLDLLGVVIVEGDHPGSTYYAAELKTDIAEANALAIKHQLDIRFVSGRYY